MIDVYYHVDVDECMWWVDKAFYDKNGCINDDDSDTTYRAIEDALEACDCPRMMEANAEILTSEEEMVKDMRIRGFNMIRNDKILF